MDVVVPASTRLRYGEIEERLRTLGLRNDVREGAPICRWITPEEFTLDVMPVSGDVLGFKNGRYEAALAQASPFDLGEGLVILIPGAPVFLGTKWEAFASRGESDVLGSHDLEDVISVLAGRPAIVGEVAASSPTLRAYLAQRTLELLADDRGVYAIQGALPDAEHIPGLISRTVRRIREIANLHAE